MILLVKISYEDSFDGVPILDLLETLRDIRQTVTVTHLEMEKNLIVLQICKCETAE